MITRHLSRWVAPLALTLGVTGVLVSLDADWPTIAVVAVITLVAAWWVSPLRRSSDMPHIEATHRAAADGAIVVYWRPGCPFCARLRRGLGPQRRHAIWINIWADEDAAAFVRSVNDGNEIVPTVMVGADDVWTNPDPTRVRQKLPTR